MACSPSKPLPWTPAPLTYTPRFVPCERMWPGSHPRGGVNPNDGLLRHIAQLWASLSSWPSLPIGSGPPGPPLKRPIVWRRSSGDNPVCVQWPVPSWVVLLHPRSPGAGCAEPAARLGSTGERPVGCAVYNNARCRSMCLHQRRQLCTMEQRHCQSQSNGCVQRSGGGGGICGDWGRSLCVLNVQGGCKDPMWDARG